MIFMIACNSQVCGASIFSFKLFPFFSWFSNCKTVIINVSLSSSSSSSSSSPMIHCAFNGNININAIIVCLSSQSKASLPSAITFKLGINCFQSIYCRYTDVTVTAKLIKIILKQKINEQTCLTFTILSSIRFYTCSSNTSKRYILLNID